MGGRGQSHPNYQRDSSVRGRLAATVDPRRSVTPATQRLLQHWRTHEFRVHQRPFFCQVEAVETMIWLTEVAPTLGPRGKKFLDHVEGANAQANPELLRLAMKMATGSGKTTVMAMLIAWHTVNAVRHPNSRGSPTAFWWSPRASPLRTACASCSPMTPTATTGPANSSPPTCCPTWPRPRSLSPTSTRSSAGSEWRSPAWPRSIGRPRRRDRHGRDRRPDAAPCYARTDGHQEHRRAERRGPSLLPRAPRWPRPG